MKYRIKKFRNDDNREMFIPQKRTLFFFWRNITIIKYGSMNDAKRAIDQYIYKKKRKACARKIKPEYIPFKE